MRAWACFIYTVLFFIITFSLVLISSPEMTKPIIIVMGCMWLYGIIKFIVGGGEVEDNKREEHFTNDDWINCKVGEWISRK